MSRGGGAMSLRFNMLLEQVGADPASVRLLRHQPMVGGRSLLDIWRTDRPAFEIYQAHQFNNKRPYFARHWWAAFIGTWDGRTIFAGLYRVGEPLLVEAAYRDELTETVHPAGIIDRFPTEHAADLGKYEGKLFIDWGGGASGKRAWVQRADLQNKLITELRLTGSEEPFPGLMELAKPLSALSAAPSSWIEQLSAARGVYLLSCPRDGSLYVGKATAAGGFWSRWSEYRANGHGGNVALSGREPSDFVASILQVAGSTDTDDQIDAAEQLWKRKLQSRELGLNRN